MIVADTNLVSYLLVSGERTEEARGVWARDPSWVLPTLWRSEFLNVLATMVRTGRLDETVAQSAWQRAVALFKRCEAEPSGERVLETAVARDISAYDAQFVVAAEELAVPLVTFDGGLLAACPEVAVGAGDFAADG